MNERPLESMVTHLVQCTCNSVINCPKGNANGLVQSKNLTLKQPITDLCTEDTKDNASMTWNAILKGLLSRCSHFCNCRDELVNIPRPLVNARWRETNDRKVLAPLALKQNTDNIIAGNVAMNGKRKADVDFTWAPSKRIKLDGTIKSCSVVIKRTSARNLLLQYKCLSKESFVKLFDILKEIPQEKEEEKPVYQNEFMGFLGLETKQSVNTKQLPEYKTSHPVKLVSHPHIPFSSDYGRRLLARERHCLPQEVALRKIERMEWYLKGSAANPKHNYKSEITYDKQMKYTHTYKFPKRQFYQNHVNLTEGFLQYLCKPVCVELQAIDVASFVAKMKELNSEMNAVEYDGSKDDETISISDSSSSACSDIFIVNGEMAVVNGDCSEVITVNDERFEPVVADKGDCNYSKLVCKNKSYQKRSSKSLVYSTVQNKNVRRSSRLSHVNNTL